MTSREKGEVEVRRAAPGDIPAIMAVERDIPGIAHWSERSYGRIFESAAPVRIALVAVEGHAGAIRGFLFARVSAGHSELENLAVAAEWRRCGVGSALLQRFLAEAGEFHLGSITLEVRESNQGARALYEKYGFAKGGRRRSYYRDPEEDALVYTLTCG